MVRLQLDPEAVLFRRVDDEVVALELATDMYLAVDGTGRMLWDLLDVGTDVDAMVAALTAGWDVDEPTARADVEAFVADLRSRGLLQVVDD